jgi:hypothetical protein
MFYTFVTLLGCWGPFLNQNNEKKKLRKMKKVEKSSQSQSHDFDFFGILKKVKVMILTLLDFMTCGTSLP